MRFIILFYLLFATDFTHAQEDHHHNHDHDFQSPLGIPLYLSGTFAELRGNHFHGGIDIKTNQKTGYRVYASQSGFVSRVKVQEGGYGNAIYIQHPNGYTTVYGHLSEFKMGIDDYVKQQQYAQQSFEVDLYLNANQFPVNKGDVIALSGNSGSSGGPHVHYEIRKTEGQVPINPLKYIDVKDDINPTIYGLRIHDLSNGFYQSEGKTYPVAYLSPGNYKVNEPVQIQADVAGISVKSIDKLNGSNNSNGFYGLRLYVDDVLTYSYQKDAVSFDETRKINAHVDYPEKKRGGGTYVNCFRLKGNDLSFIENSSQNNGKIWLSEYKTRTGRLEIFDYKGNTSTVTFTIENTATSPSVWEARETLYHNEYNQVSRESFNATIPPNALYEDVHLDYAIDSLSNPLTIAPVYSAFHSLQSNEIPLQRFITVEVKPTSLPAELKSKALVANVTDFGKQRIDVNAGTWIGDYLQVKTRNFGTYFITTDTQNPNIRQYQAPKNNNFYASSKMQFKISDDLSGIKTYRGEVDGQWILMEYDRKNNLLYHRFDERISKGKHQLTLTVTDYVGNSTTEVIDFTR